MGALSRTRDSRKAGFLLARPYRLCRGREGAVTGFDKRHHITRQFGRRNGQIDYRIAVAIHDTNTRRTPAPKSDKLHLFPHLVSNQTIDQSKVGVNRTPSTIAALPLPTIIRQDRVEFSVVYISVATGELVQEVMAAATIKDARIALGC